MALDNAGRRLDSGLDRVCFEDLVCQSAPPCLNGRILSLFRLVCRPSPAPQLVRVLPKPALIMLIAGGLVYTFGAIVYATKICNFVPKRFGFHEMFHIFVGLGTVLHFLMIYLYII